MVLSFSLILGSTTRHCTMLFSFNFFPCFCFLLSSCSIPVLELIETFRSNGIETYGCEVIRPKIGLLHRSLYTIRPMSRFFNQEDPIAFQKKGNSSTTVHCCGQSCILGPNKIHFVIQLKHTTDEFESNGNNDVMWTAGAWHPRQQLSDWTIAEYR